MTSDQSAGRRPVVFEEASNSDEELHIHQEGILFRSHEALKPFITIKMARVRVADVQQLGTCFHSVISICSLSVFPHLFPFGYGHPGTERKEKLSFHQCIKHYSYTYSGRVDQDDTVQFTASDIISRKGAVAQISPVRKLNPSEITNCESVAASELAE